MTDLPGPALTLTFNDAATHGLTTDEARHLLNYEWDQARDAYLTELDSKRAVNKSRVDSIT